MFEYEMFEYFYDMKKEGLNKFAVKVSYIVHIELIM